MNYALTKATPLEYVQIGAAIKDAPEPPRTHQFPKRSTA